jgi:hypothetical protein
MAAARARRTIHVVSSASAFGRRSGRQLGQTFGLELGKLSPCEDESGGLTGLLLDIGLSMGNRVCDCSRERFSHLWRHELDIFGERWYHQTPCAESARANRGHVISSGHYEDPGQPWVCLLIHRCPGGIQLQRICGSRPRHGFMSSSLYIFLFRTPFERTTPHSCVITTGTLLPAASGGLTSSLHLR